MQQSVSQLNHCGARVDIQLRVNCRVAVWRCAGAFVSGDAGESP